MASKAKARRHTKAGWQRHLTTERVILGGALLVTVVFIALVIIDGLGRQAPSVNLNAVPETAVNYPIQGRDHIEEGSPHPPYNSNPPTSGWHYVNPEPIGIYTRELTDEALVHNLEHGHVWFSYRDADDQAAIDLLSDVQRRYPQNVIVTYRPANDARVAAASWGWALNLDELDADMLYAFVLRHRNRAPENVPG